MRCFCNFKTTANASGYAERTARVVGGAQRTKHNEQLKMLWAVERERKSFSCSSTHRCADLLEWFTQSSPLTLAIFVLHHFFLIWKKVVYLMQSTREISLSMETLHGRGKSFLRIAGYARENFHSRQSRSTRDDFSSLLRILMHLQSGSGEKCWSIKGRKSIEEMRACHLW